MITTPGQLLINQALPEKYRDYSRTMGKDEADAVLAAIATDDPDKYREVSHALLQLGRNASFDEGMTLRIRDLESPIDRKPYMDIVDRKSREIDAMDATDAEKQELKAELFTRVSDMIAGETLERGVAGNNPFALQVKSKARGNKVQLSALLSTPGTYSDHNGNVIPVFVRNSYAEGLEPDEYWSAAYGGRLGVLSTKTGTAKGGYLGKLMSAASTEVVVTGEDCETPNGVPVKADDNDNLGSVLARQAGPFAPGTVITRQVLSRLKKDGVEDIAVRSVITCGQEKGVCQKCSGKREGGDFPPLGYALGRVASSALAEQVAQQALNCLAEGTEVMMGDWSVKCIEDIVVGDTVMGCGVDGVARPVLVTATFNNGVRECVETGFVRNSYRVSVLSTPDHKFLASRCVSGNPGSETGFAPAVLPVGTRSRHFYGVPVSRFEGSSIVPNTQMFRRVSQEPVGLLPTYDIEVDHPDHLFVLANGLVCSNSKHSGRKAEGTGFSGFDVIRNLATAPETYPDRAALSEVDGVVESVSPAPQGGTNIIISGQTHYAIPGMDIYVKPGDSVSAGDTLSNGVVNPADVVRIKGLGEGRRYFMDRFTQAFRESGLGVNRRNVEAVTKAIVDHVELDDDSETGLPGDTVTYSGFASAYRPRTGSSASDPVRAEGKYLEQPYLHYSIGTKVTPSVAGNLKKYGFGEVLVNPDPVPVKPKFVSLVRTPEYVDDWIARMGSSYLNTRLLKDVWSGAESDIHGLNPLPGLARASEFGEPPKGSKSPY